MADSIRFEEIIVPNVKKCDCRIKNYLCRETVCIVLLFSKVGQVCKDGGTDSWTWWPPTQSENINSHQSSSC